MDNLRLGVFLSIAEYLSPLSLLFLYFSSIPLHHDVYSFLHKNASILSKKAIQNLAVKENKKIILEINRICPFPVHFSDVFVENDNLSGLKIFDEVSPILCKKAVQYSNSCLYYLMDNNCFFVSNGIS